MTEDAFYRALYKAPALARRVVPAQGHAGVSAREIQILAGVLALGEPSVSELAKLLAYRHPTVSVAINQLLMNGYAERVDSVDGRERRVAIRAKGRQVLRDLFETRALNAA